MSVADEHRRPGDEESSHGDARPPQLPATFMAVPAAEYAAPMLRAVAGDLELRVRAALSDRYDVRREIGRGGMAVVFLAHDRKLGRDVAIKVLGADGARLVRPERFEREIALVARLQHPHIVALYESGEADGVRYFVMPFVRGETLRDRLRRERRLPTEDALAILHAVAAALDFAHGLGVVHRDVKPENILLLPDGQAQLADFGIALALDRSEATTLTEPGLAPGTRRYMSPEQLRGDEAVGPASDLYSLALVAREMLLGAPAFEPGAPLPAAPPRAATPRLSRAADAVLRRAFADDPAMRFPAAQAFATALADAARRGRYRIPRTRYMLRIGAVASLAVVAAVAASAVRDRLPARAASSRPDSSVRVVVVLPADVRGAKHARSAGIGEALVQPLSMQLDAATDIRVVDPRAVLARVARGEASDGGVALARSLGASDYVTGSIVALEQGRIRAFLTMHSLRSSDGREPISAEATGDIDGLPQLVDSLARQLLIGLVPRPYRDMARVASGGTASASAFVAFLDGERHYRARRYDSATVWLNRAIEIDSTFAIALHRLRVAYTATPIAIPGPRDLRQRTLRHAARLPEHQRLLVRALDAFNESRPFEAESLYKRVLVDHPHDVEALLYLANVQIHYLGNWGLPLDTPKVVLERLLRIDPGHAGAVEKLAMIAGAQMRSVASESLLKRLEPLESGEFRLVTQDVHAFRRGDTVAQEAALAALDTAPTSIVSMAAHRGGGVYPGHLAARVRMAELLTRPHRTPDQQARGHLMIADVELARGRLRAADAARAAAARISPDAALEGFLRAFVAEPAFEHRSPTELAEARRWVEAALANGARDSVQQRFLLAVLDARLGRHAAARGHADVLDRWSRRLAHRADSTSRHDPGTGASLGRRSARLASLAVAIRADVERRRGNPARALALLRDWHPERWWTFALHDAVRAQPYERRLHAEVLEATGHCEQAVRWYEVWHGPLVTGTAYSTTGRLRMARLLERCLGRPVEAREAYLQVVDALRDADPALWHLRDEARRAADRLRPPVRADPAALPTR